ncbi:hypothetical protein BDY21DRAFT_376496 [Lineolata rhizophorae]|uniref:Helicase C-terminal domain-containing protein n=1 Tax=Lineolata rhizophorae TaxID=578093 RepID=A0A6A6PCE5_9PEZI|nr:hypothetical protein BDY21DRAFT_376496 [Lineolata rhizophorae]
MCDLRGINPKTGKKILKGEARPGNDDEDGDVWWEEDIPETQPAVYRRLAWFCERLLEDVVGKGEKILLYASNLIEQYMVELFLTIMGISFMGIDDETNSTERSEIIRNFNAESHEARVLVTTYRTSATALNMQQTCHIAVMFSPTDSANTEIQSGWRL